MEECHDTVASTIDASHDELYNINKQLHSNPETAYQEHFAHETLTTYLSSRGFDVKSTRMGSTPALRLSLVRVVVSSSSARSTMLCLKLGTRVDTT